jgi:uncharacterized membrane protein YfcA
MRTIKRYLLKLLVGAIIGAVVGALFGGILVGSSWGASAIIGACIFMALSTLYGRATIHSEPAGSGATYKSHGPV